MSQVEYRVRPVVRYVVTRYTASEALPYGPHGEERRTTASLETLGEFDSEHYAEEVCRVMGLEDWRRSHYADGPAKEQHAEQNDCQSELGIAPVTRC